MVPPRQSSDHSLTHWIDVIRSLAGKEETARKAAILDAWDQLGTTERFVFNKIITGGFRMGVSQKLMTRALARATGQPEADLALRLMGDWDPAKTSMGGNLIEADLGKDASASRPYPFCLAYGLEDALSRRSAPPRRLARRMEMGRHAAAN